MIGHYNLSSLLTWLGAAFGTAGLSFAAAARFAPAMSCLILAGLCDLYDGTFAARFLRTPEEKAFGREIDSLADAVSFLALPAVLAFQLAGTGVAAATVMVLYVLAGVTRLAYFNLTGIEETKAGRYYRGLPVTYAALIFPALYLPLSYLPDGIFRFIWLGLCLLTGAAFVLDRKIAKPDRRASLILFGAALLLLLLYALRGMRP